MQEKSQRKSQPAVVFCTKHPSLLLETCVDHIKPYISCLKVIKLSNMSCYKLFFFYSVGNQIHWLKNKRGNDLKSTFFFQNLKLRENNAEDVGLISRTCNLISAWGCSEVDGQLIRQESTSCQNYSGGIRREPKARSH